MTTFYTIMRMTDRRTISTIAQDRVDALAKFGEELGVSLTLDEGPHEAPGYMMDEFTERVHWTNFHIPVYEVP